MKKILKPIFSLMTISLFLVLALASFGPDASTNTSVAVSDCMSQPPISGSVNIVISYKSKEGNPIPDASGKVYIWRQEVISDDTCKVTGLGAIPLSEDIYTNASGNFTVSGYPYTFDNKEDLHRVEVIIEKNAIYSGCRTVQVRKYGSSATFAFNCIGIRFNDL